MPDLRGSQLSGTLRFIFQLCVDIAVELALIILILLSITLFIMWLRAKEKSKQAVVEVNKIIEALRSENEDKTSSVTQLESSASDLKAKVLQCEITIKDLKDKAAPVEGVDNRVKALTVRYDDLNQRTKQIEEDYKVKKATYDKLSEQVAVFDDKLAFAELGVYEPHFDFGDAEVFKEKIKQVRDEQKKLISAKSACACPTDWTVNGSVKQGETMINRQMRLTMRAFNNECEAAISNARWNNVVAMEKRILNAAKQINDANASMQLFITNNYISLKVKELHLTHEYREQQKIEKDERLERARLEREEKKLIADAEKAEKEEAKYQALLDKARAEAGTDVQRIAELEKALEDAHQASERARAMAEMTKSGYVYIISNVGSFGEDVVKIGLTRRLDPDDRVKELGDASVPFTFDTHAMIYSDEAPALENALHREFEDRRVNMSNYRKEFFRVSLDEVEDAVSRLAPGSTFFKDREAQEWQETMARRNAMLAARSETETQFPDSI